ncbi:peptidoglycan DD-metalloendopeptidase family protein [Methylobacter sp.]|uniref:peptidoglycan DD-metalloendopeptidase family protein n=1 Tax=Methylobacter sp. TaxID=2051955 RepID=UPI003DA4F4B3
MKKRIYTTLFLGISAAFTATTSYAQTLPTHKSGTTKTVALSTRHSGHAKSVKKRNTAASKTGNKRQVIASTIKKHDASSASKNHKKYIASSKLNKKSHRQTTAKEQSQALFQLSHRKRSVITHHSIKTTPIHIADNKTRLQESPTNISRLDLGEYQPGHTAESYEPFEKEASLQMRNQNSNHKTASAHVTIETSLFLDGLDAGLSKELIMQLTDIFAWDIDFATNLRNGDYFTVVYEKKVVNGKETNTDEIIAAQFTNQGSTYTAVRYIDETGRANYYTPDGQSMQKAFLSTPVDFARISSHFDLNRKHPILNRIRAHKGVDYAARTGTPVKTTGDGEVIFSGRKGGYGQVVIIKHGDHYETLYAHLSNFKKGLQVGSHVKQGDVIGYIGQTGLATGPHLHYEFHVDGVYRNPETVKLPNSLPIGENLLADFKSQTQPLLAQLNQIKAKSLFAKTQSQYN